MAEEGGRPRGVHTRGVSAKQRLHLAALLICLAALPLQAQNDIDFDPEITEEQFATFSRLVAQGIYATPVAPARAGGLLRFDIGIAATALPVDTNAEYWQRAVGDDFTISDYVAVPRLVVSKGIMAATVSASYSRVQGTDIAVLGGALDVPIIDGGLVRPTLAVRAAYARLQGIDELDLATYGLELFLSKGFGPITPYIAAGRTRSDAEARITDARITDTIVLSDEGATNRYTAGVRLSLFIPKISIEATQAEERSYAAKVSFGF